MKPEVSTNDYRIQVTRVFNAPRPRVFAWWTTAEKYQQWSGCKEATRCEVIMDFRVGGSFVQKMQIAVNGESCEFTISGTYEEIIELERIRYDAKFGPAPVRVTVEFLELGKSTKVVITHQGVPNDFFGQSVSRGTAESFDMLVLLVGSEPVEAVQ
jgi:uncharacterized protein YndB with AHSA1/START domain